MTIHLSLNEGKVIKMVVTTKHVMRRKPLIGLRETVGCLLGRPGPLVFYAVWLGLLIPLSPFGKAHWVFIFYLNQTP